MWFVYILKCNDGSFYTGISTNTQNRLMRHNAGKGSQYTRARRPVTLVYVEEFVCKSDAEKREVEIKKFSIKNKEKLIKYGHGQRFPSSQKL